MGTPKVEGRFAKSLCGLKRGRGAKMEVCPGEGSRLGSPFWRTNQERKLALFGFFEEGQTGAFVLGHDIAFGKGIHCTCTRGGSEIVKGNGRSATEGLLATVKVVGFSIFLAGAAE